MDILIKNMEIPSERIMLEVFPDGKVFEIHPTNNARIPTEAEAIEVPPHGNLKDADLLQEALSIVLSLVMTPDLTDKEIALVQRTIGAISEAVNDIDTIVEASK